MSKQDKKEIILTDHDHLIAFLMNYDVMAIYGTYKNLLKHMFETTHLPIDLLTFKFFEFMIFKKKEISEVYEMFKEKEDAKESELDSIVKILELINKKQVIFKEYNVREYIENVKYFNILKPMSNQNNKNIDVPHSGLPPPDPEKGRVHLGWRRCAFYNCNKTFTSTIDLVEHLIKCNVYTNGYHYYHEEAVKDLNLTPEKVIADGNTKCPSLLCNNKDFNTPQELINHLQYLGIEPFWVKGMKFEEEKPPSIADSKKAYDIHYPKLFESEQCLLCLEAPPQVVAGNCRHHIVCTKCFIDMKIGTKTKICPMCRSNVGSFYPFY